MDGAARVQIYLELKNRTQTALSQAKKYLNQDVQEMKAKINELKQYSASSFTAMSSEVPGFGRAVELATNPYVLAAAAVAGLGTAMKHASDMAQVFDSKMAHANVTLQLSKPELHNASSQVLDIAARSTTKDAANAAPDALNIFAYANLSDDPLQNYKLSLAAVEPTLKAVKWGYSDVETAARAAALSMSASKITDINRVYDILAATLNKGNAEFNTIAQYLPKLTGQAHDAGFSFEQTAGAFAFMTHTLSGEKSSTMLENVIKSLGDTSKLQNFRDIGVDVFDKVTHKMNPLVTTISQLHHAMSGLNDLQRAKILGSLGLDIESRAGLSTMINDVAGLKASIDGTTNSAGQAQLAFDNAKTPLDGWVRITNDMDVGWKKLGHSFNETIYGPLADWLVKTGDVLMPILQQQTARLTPIWDGIKSILSSSWDIIASIASSIWDVVKPVVALLDKSQLVSDVFWLIGKGLSVVGFLLKETALLVHGIGHAFVWVFEHTFQPILNGVEWLYDKLKSITGLKPDTAKPYGYIATGKAEATAKQQTNLYENGKPTKEALDTLNKIDKKTKKEGEGGITGGEHVRNITINKMVFAEHLTTSNPQLSSMNVTELEKWFTEMMQRAVLGLARS